MSADDICTIVNITKWWITVFVCEASFGRTTVFLWHHAETRTVRALPTSLYEARGDFARESSRGSISLIIFPSHLHWQYTHETTVLTIPALLYHALHLHAAP